MRTALKVIFTHSAASHLFIYEFLLVYGSLPIHSRIPAKEFRFVQHVLDEVIQMPFNSISFVPSRCHKIHRGKFIYFPLWHAFSASNSNFRFFAYPRQHKSSTKTNSNITFYVTSTEIAVYVLPNTGQMDTMCVLSSSIVIWHEFCIFAQPNASGVIHVISIQRKAKQKKRK